MAWLVAEDRVLATAEIASTWKSRARGVLGRDGIDGVLVLDPAKGVHTIGVRFDLDVAYCRRTDDDALRVIAVACMRPNRIGLPRMSAHVVIEAEHGAFERWDVSEGDILELRLSDPDRT